MINGRSYVNELVECDKSDKRNSRRSDKCDSTANVDKTESDNGSDSERNNKANSESYIILFNILILYL